MRLALMKRYATALLFCTLSLTSLAARADIIDDAIGNIQQVKRRTKTTDDYKRESSQ